MFCEVFCYNIFHFGVRVSCFAKCSTTIFFTLVFMLHILLFVFHHLVLCSVFIYSSFDSFYFLVMFVGNGGFAQ
jgi:hypothetical protein